MRTVAKRVVVRSTGGVGANDIRENARRPDLEMVGVWVQMSGGLGPDGIAVNADGFVAVAHGQAGRAWIFDPLGDLVARVRTPGGLWTTAVAWHPDGRHLAIVEAQTGSIYLADVASALATSKERMQ